MALAKWKRRIEVGASSHPELTLQQALDLVVSGKRTEGLRERTITKRIIGILRSG
ncbi:hypothetical protein [Paenibacillus sp. LHD-38]|uniref:hypothetical protein n=1 Tax=Paenibacillus sp. LHD-38 TaxID=3072143 RepID=UPI00280E377C|nr:hypothetical protein [Paenibacillus sp. LHD-38]MDQ8733198.1 hypothetical protein [Paenibacillus sp. LHD-38]